MNNSNSNNNNSSRSLSPPTSPAKKSNNDITKSKSKTNNNDTIKQEDALPKRKAERNDVCDSRSVWVRIYSLGLRGTEEQKSKESEREDWSDGARCDRWGNC